MADWQLDIQGADAGQAAAALCELEGVEATWQPVEGDYREGTMAAIATVIGIVGGSIAIAEKLHKWYSTYRQRQTAQGAVVEKVVIIAGDQRLLLEGKTVAEIKQWLDVLESA
ncbi:MAG: hypothetical protein HC838_03555 [Spirulinaceae cyanobacterium RM2_2_10]|nr:hypothetical protein [Spirulinaceae cyanobacterium SM2_1_0]NJO19323.1 hypothetical protein [Spirulinaceae cyanobacterium RM2_2_10]